MTRPIRCACPFNTQPGGGTHALYVRRGRLTYIDCHFRSHLWTNDRSRTQTWLEQLAKLLNFLLPNERKRVGEWRVSRRASGKWIARGKNLATPSWESLRWPARLEASLAQLVEQLIRNEQVVGSNPTTGSKLPSPLRLWQNLR